jgi:APA family basic amino acid/polyamine antiporter
MSLTMVGLAPYSTLNVANPVSVAISAGGEQLAWLLPLVNLGAIAGLSTVILISLYGQSRIFYSMSRDGMLPWFDKVSPTFGTPVRGTLIIGVFSALFGGLFPLDILGELVSIGTLLAFVLVCIGVIVLRYTKPNVPRPFKAPWSPVVPILGVIVCGAMMALLPGDTWIRLGVWFILGMLVYAVYGARNAKRPAWMIGDAPPAK